MTYLEALYGSQYADLKFNNQPIENGRTNGNMFMTALIIMSIICLFGVFMLLVTALKMPVTISMKSISETLGVSNNMLVVYILLPAILIVYFIWSKTLGSEDAYLKYCKGYEASSEVDKLASNKKSLRPLFACIVLFFLIIFLSTVIHP